jgi:hypothetical protein
MCPIPGVLLERGNAVAQAVDLAMQFVAGCLHLAIASLDEILRLITADTYFVMHHAAAGKG